ncbi:hypothetical protein ABKA04_003598 [Annulohypoxylon sp. FPYF3050]
MYHYAKLIKPLREAGFEVHIPRLLAMNESRPPNTDLFTDTDLIRGYATSLIEAGHSVAVLMHSYGGQVGTNALYGLSATARAAKGLKGGNIPPDLHMPVAFGFDADDSCVPNFPKEGLVGEPYVEKIEPEEFKTYVSSLVRWNGKSMYQPIKNTSAWRDDVDISYIYTSGDLTVPVDYQKNRYGGVYGEGRQDGSDGGN